MRIRKKNYNMKLLKIQNVSSLNGETKMALSQMRSKLKKKIHTHDSNTFVVRKKELIACYVQHILMTEEN